LGYGFKTTTLLAQVNAYYTEWRDKGQTGVVDRRNPELGSYNMTGINARHTGIEVELKYKPTKDLSITGMLSIGDWKWLDNAEAYVFNDSGQPVDSKGKVVELNSEEHRKEVAKLKDVHVDDAAQTTAALGINYKLTKNLKIGADYNYFAKLFARPDAILDIEGIDTWEAPDYGIMDANLKYTFKIGPFDAIATAKVMNLTNQTYIADAYGNTDDWRDVRVFYGFKRTWSAGLKIKF
jgi:outer membrane receptor protein involved in Fe transport